MTPVVQSRVGLDGTCFRAALASILDLKESQVPDFGEEGWIEEANDFLAKHGLKYRRVPVTSAKPDGYSTIEGISPRGGLHACVAKDGELVWDPHPVELNDGQGLVEPRYWGLLEPTAKRKALDAEPSNLDELRKKEAAAFRRVMKAMPSSPRQRDLHDQWQTIRKAYLAERERTKTIDRADTLQLRKNTERQGGPFFMQVTEKNGKEHTVPVSKMGTTDVAPVGDASKTSVVALLLALVALYRANRDKRPFPYDLTTYQPPKKFL